MDARPTGDIKLAALTPAVTANPVPFVGHDLKVQGVSRLGHRPALDGLRGVAVLCVLAVNSLLPFLKGGFMGVDIFFVLSGFLITSLLAEEWDKSGTINLKRFYLRRALRLLPGLFLLLAACCLYAVFFQSREMAGQTYREAFWVVFYFANWMLTSAHEVGSLDHAWSLSVEEQFYLLWPLCFYWLLSVGMRRSRVLLLLSALAAASALWRTALWQSNAHYLRLYYGSDTRADALLVGCLLGLLFSWNQLALARMPRLGQRLLAGLAICFLGVIGRWVPYDTPFLYQGGLTLISLAAGVLLLEAVCVPGAWLGRALSSTVLGWIGRISYSLYLWHYPVFTALRAERFAALGWNPILVQSVRFAAVFGVACLSYYCVEQPFLHLKKRFAAPI